MFGMASDKKWLKRIAVAGIVWYIISSPVHAAHTANKGANQVKHAGTQGTVFLDHLGK